MFLKFQAKINAKKHRVIFLSYSIIKEYKN
jgi:hypothetical protein